MSDARQNGGLIVREKHTHSRAPELLKSSLVWSGHSTRQTPITSRGLLVLLWRVCIHALQFTVPFPASSDTLTILS